MKINTTHFLMACAAMTVSCSRPIEEETGIARTSLVSSVTIGSYEVVGSLDAECYRFSTRGPARPAGIGALLRDTANAGDPFLLVLSRDGNSDGPFVMQAAPVSGGKEIRLSEEQKTRLQPIAELMKRSAAEKCDAVKDRPNIATRHVIVRYAPKVAAYN